MRGFIVAAALVAVLVLCASSADAQLLVSKKLLSKVAVESKDLIVHIHIFNIGNTAYSVSVDDSLWSSSDFDVVVGLPTANWDVVPAGTNVSHTFVLRPKLPGVVYAGPARVSYLTSPKGATKFVQSSPLGRLVILSTFEDDIRNAPHYREWIFYTLLSAAPIALPFAVWTFIQNNYNYGIPIAIRPKTKSS